MDNKLYTPLKSALLIGFYFCSILPAFPYSFPNNDHPYRAESINDRLTMEKMMDIITENFSDRQKIDSVDTHILFRILDTLGVKTENDLNELIGEYLDPAIEEEQRICREMLEEYEQNGILSSADGFYADENKLENIQKGRYFIQSGIIRQMLIIKYGKEMDNIIRGSDIEDVYNLEKILEDEYEEIE